MMIKDLAVSTTLDRAAMTEVAGGLANRTDIWRSALFGSPVTTTNVDTYISNYSFDSKVANVQQNTLALFGSAAASNATIIQA